MKKKYSILLGVAVAIIIFLGFKMPANAASYKAQIILESYEISEDYKIGEDTSIKVVFRNTDSSYFIRNVLINCSSNGNTIIPVEGKSNQIYVDSIRPNDTVEVEIPIVITRSENGYASMTFSIEYMSDDTRWSANSYIIFPVVVAESPIVLKNVSVPEDVIQNASALVSTYFLNSSDKEMFNTEFVVAGEISGGERITSLGTIQSRRNSYAENYITFTDAGEKLLTLSIRYDDASGETHEEILGQYTVDVKSNISSANTSISDSNGDVNNQNSSQGELNPSGILLLASGIIVLIIIVVVIINVTRKRK